MKTRPLGSIKNNKGELCEICGTNKKTSQGKDSNGRSKYRSVCNSCYQKPYTRFKKSKCEQCGFIPLHRCQLDVHHIDHNHRNNSAENLQTLCANCHRIVSHLRKLEVYKK